MQFLSKSLQILNHKKIMFFWTKVLWNILFVHLDIQGYKCQHDTCNITRSTPKSILLFHSHINTLEPLQLYLEDLFAFIYEGLYSTILVIVLYEFVLFLFLQFVVFARNSSRLNDVSCKIYLELLNKEGESHQMIELEPF